MSDDKLKIGLPGNVPIGTEVHIPACEKGWEISRHNPPIAYTTNISDCLAMSVPVEPGQTITLKVKKDMDVTIHGRIPDGYKLVKKWSFWRLK